MAHETATSSVPAGLPNEPAVSTGRQPWRTPRVIVVTDASAAESTTNVPDDGPSEVS